MLSFRAEVTFGRCRRLRRQIVPVGLMPMRPDSNYSSRHVFGGIYKITS